MHFKLLDLGNDFDRMMAEEMMKWRALRLLVKADLNRNADALLPVKKMPKDSKPDLKMGTLTQ